MPIRRKSDGKAEKAAFESLKKSARGCTESDTTEVIESRGARRKDSLFQDGGIEDDGRYRVEERTLGTEARAGAEDPKTRIMRPRRRGSGASAQSIEETGNPMLDPPVGWLVIVSGPGKGHVLTLGNGMNSIGRGESARVRINYGDDTIARSNHARLAYEPRKRRFLLSHGEGANLTYADGEVVMESIEIQSGAIIEIGATRLRFQAFCSPEFDWPDIND